jgi:flagellar protein FliS
MAYNPYNKYVKKYQESNVNTADPKKIMIMLFDACLQFLQKAVTAIEEKNLAEKTANITSAKQILREFMRTIDLEQGNDASKHLYLFYNRKINILTKASIHRDAEAVRECIKDLTDIKLAFEEAIRIVNQDISKTEHEEERILYEQSLREEQSRNDYEV